eukprot:CAMPEP_0183351962 /NCGR_PEP_ID=MMETSP0164_2-20130417/26575_1 /TAXON_ID=221442 /ORGANISM="Coccolithus pelagicus ssp braarudi, Strain PLY182g" /LENGTH=39 /DNA_ID= /DNA_START= /DNA_END= /DNA_ORIENTATION=
MRASQTAEVRRVAADARLVHRAAGMNDAQGRSYDLARSR